MKRKVDLVVISDLHLGTYGCHAKELLHYLESIEPERVILNGDIIDGWHFSKRYFPKWHMKVVQHLIKWISEQKEIIYITGNHDEMLRKFVGFKMNNFKIENKAVIELGGVGYNILILLNRLVNCFSEKLGRGKISFSKKIKNSVKGAVKHINKFEVTAAKIAASEGYSHVICGHIHQAVKKDITTKEGIVTYLNSGDWIENLTSLEYNEGKWTIFNYLESDLHFAEKISDEVLAELNDHLIFQKLLLEFNLQPKKP